MWIEAIVAKRSQRHPRSQAVQNARLSGGKSISKIAVGTNGQRSNTPFRSTGERRAIIAEYRAQPSIGLLENC